MLDDITVGLVGRIVVSTVIAYLRNDRRSRRHDDEEEALLDLDLDAPLDDLVDVTWNARSTATLVNQAQSRPTSSATPQRSSWACLPPEVQQMILVFLFDDLLPVPSVTSHLAPESHDIDDDEAHKSVIGSLSRLKHQIRILGRKLRSGRCCLCNSPYMEALKS